MKNKTVKEKVEKILNNVTCGLDFRPEGCVVCKNLLTKIDKLYRKEIDKYKEALIWCSGSQDFQIEGKARIGWNKICRPLLKSKTSSTCCNIEVSEPKEIEVMCPWCGEWITTK